MGRAVSPGFPDLGVGVGSERGTCVLGALGWFLHQQLLTSPTSESVPTPRDGRGSTGARAAGQGRRARP